MYTFHMYTFHKFTMIFYIPLTFFPLKVNAFEWDNFNVDKKGILTQPKHFVGKHNQF